MSTPERRTILLVEDSPDDRALVRRLLRERPEYALVEVGSGTEGLEVCRTDPPDCVLLDYHLADMDGSEFLRTLRADAGGPALPVVVLTGREDDAVAADALEHGAQDYLAKDALNARGLIRAIRNAIENFRIRRKIEEQHRALQLRAMQLEALQGELQQRLAELADAHSAKEQFLAVMSHEMRTPLNAILGYTDLMAMGIGGELPAGQREHLERIRVGGRHLLDLINDVLDLARADVHKLELDIHPVDVRAVLEEVVALLESQAEAKGFPLVLEPCPERIPHVQADLRRLRQILTNLIGNAIKFTEEGEVRVSCGEVEGGMIRVRVADTGIGIAPDALPLVFREFYQVKGSLTRERGGSGLGLAISQRLAHAMGGDILVESTLGEGSVFTLLIPAAAAGSEPRAREVDVLATPVEEHAARRRPQRPGVVVAFGDDPEALSELASRVEPQVHLVWTTNPGAVPELARRERATLVVLDVTCADGAAWRVAHAMQDVPELHNTAVLLLPRIPAPATDESSGEIDLGWVAVVPKPFTPEQIQHAVSHAASTVRDTRGQGSDARPDFEVLVVDDDADSRRVATGFLRDSGARVREAADGESALASMRAEPPDVVVLDLMMPVLDGFGVLAAMHSDPLLATIPVVVLSAKSLSDAERRFLSRTAVRVLQKGEHRLADVAALVLRAASRVSQPPRLDRDPARTEPPVDG